MTNILTLMNFNSTLFGAIIVVGTLAYLGAIAIDPSHPLPRLIVGYVSGAALVVIGAGGAYFGASYELPLIFSGTYNFDMFHMEWLALGVAAIIVGALIVRQSFRRQ